MLSVSRSPSCAITLALWKSPASWSNVSRVSLAIIVSTEIRWGHASIRWANKSPNLETIRIDTSVVSKKKPKRDGRALPPWHTQTIEGPTD